MAFTKNTANGRDEELASKKATVTADLAKMATKAAQVQAALAKIEDELAQPAGSDDVEAELVKLRKLGPEKEAHERVLIWVEGQSNHMRRELAAIENEQQRRAVARKTEQIALAKQRIVAGVEAVLPFLQDLRGMEKEMIALGVSPDYFMGDSAGAWSAPLEAFLVNAGGYTRVVGPDSQVRIERAKVA